MTLWFSIVKLIKYILYIRGEKYDFSATSLRFMPNTRPARMVYLESGNDIVRNDLLQIKFLEKQTATVSITLGFGDEVIIKTL